MQIHKIAAFLDELEKIGGRMQSAGYTQSRRGTRPYRVDTLLSRSSEPPQDAQIQAPDADQPIPAESASSDGAEQEEVAVGKTAAADRPMSERAMEGMTKVRPYAVSGIKAGIPAALFAKVMAGEGAKGTHAARAAGLVGAGLGIANEYMKQWAEKHKQRGLAKKILSTGER